MPILDTTLNRLQKYLGKEITVEELDDLLFRIGFELDSAKESQGDYELKIEITPDRSDCLSTIGLARQLRLYLGVDKPRRYCAKEETQYEIHVDPTVKKIRPYIAGFIVKNLNISESDLIEIIWTQEKLHDTFCRNRRKASIGLYSFSKISWPLRYYAEDPDKIMFTPLDFDEVLTGREILEKHPTGQKYAFILKEYSKFPLFVDAENKVLSMPPIINSRDLGEIKVGEKSILVETTGSHKETMMQTINILATMFIDMGGTVESVRIIYPENVVERSPYLSKSIKCLDMSYLRKILGLNISVSQAEKLFEKMGFLINRRDNYILYVEVPPYRTDIFHEIDIVDDIARAYGFDNFKLELTPVFTVGSEIQLDEKINFIRDIMVGLGFSEVFTFSLTSTEEQFIKMRLSVPDKIIRIAGAKEAKINMVRYWLLPEILKALAESKAKEYPIKMFEVEDVVEVFEDLEAKAKNKTHLCVVMSGTKMSYTQIRSIIEYVFASIGCEIETKRHNHESFIEGRCAAIFFKNKKIGFMGEIHPEVLNNFGLSMPTVAAEVDLSLVLGIEVKEVDWA